MSILLALLLVILFLVVADTVQGLRNEREDLVPKHTSYVQRPYNPMDEVQTKPLPRKMEYTIARANPALLYKNKAFIIDARSVTGYDQSGNVLYHLER